MSRRDFVRRCEAIHREFAHISVPFSPQILPQFMVIFLVCYLLLHMLMA
jgi:hypothetical protein